jgi:hypothetical protein
VKKTLIAVALAAAYMRMMKRWGDRQTVEVSRFLDEVNIWATSVNDELKTFADEYMEQRRLDTESMDAFVDEVVDRINRAEATARRGGEKLA